MAPINIILCHHVNQICLKCELTGACVTPTVRDDRTRPVKKVVRLPQRMPYLTYCLWHHGYCGFIVGMLLVGLIPSQYFFYLCSSKSCLFTFFFSLFRGPHISREDESLIWKSYGRRWVSMFMLVFFFLPFGSIFLSVYSCAWRQWFPNCFQLIISLGVSWSALHGCCLTSSCFRIRSSLFALVGQHVAPFILSLTWHPCLPLPFLFSLFVSYILDLVLHPFPFTIALLLLNS